MDDFTELLWTIGAIAAFYALVAGPVLLYRLVTDKRRLERERDMLRRDLDHQAEVAALRVRLDRLRRERTGLPVLPFRQKVRLRILKPPRVTVRHPGWIIGREENLTGKPLPKCLVSHQWASNDHAACDSYLISWWKAPNTYVEKWHPRCHFHEWLEWEDLPKVLAQSSQGATNS